MCARGTVGVCECVLARARAKKTYRGVESGVIPALFKTTCQHGIRPDFYTGVPVHLCLQWDYNLHGGHAGVSLQV